MSSEMEVFDFQGRQGVRVVRVDGEPWFVAYDACSVLGIGRVHDAVRGLDEDEKGTDTIRTPGGPQNVTIVNEPGLYSLILRSRKPEAKAFKRWITHEVLPALRKTGRYEVARLGDPLDEIEAANQRTTAAVAIARQERARADRAEETVAVLTPKAEAFDEGMSREGLLTITDFAKKYDHPPRRIFDHLKANRWVYKNGRDEYRAYRDHDEEFELRDTDRTYADGVVEKRLHLNPRGEEALRVWLKQNPIPGTKRKPGGGSALLPFDAA